MEESEVLGRLIWVQAARIPDFTDGHHLYEVIGVNTGIWVALVGTLVSLIGWSMSDSLIGAGILGFGLAHVVLGLIDAALDRRSVRENG